MPQYVNIGMIIVRYMAFAEGKSRWSLILNKCLNRPDAFLKHFSNWELKLSVLSTWTSRYLYSHVPVIGIFVGQEMETSSGSFCMVLRLAVPNRSDSVLPFFRLITNSFSFNYSAINSISLSSLAWIDGVCLSATYKTVSSAYLMTFECFTTSVISLKKTRNRNGPNIDPCETPE